MKNDIQTIKNKISVLDYLSKYLNITVAENARITSPLRPEATNPTSFSVQRDFWWDFGAGKGGDVVDLCAQHQFGGDIGRLARAHATACVRDDAVGAKAVASILTFDEGAGTSLECVDIQRLIRGSMIRYATNALFFDKIFLQFGE